jgi:hypothetical protein
VDTSTQLPLALPPQNRTHHLPYPTEDWISYSEKHQPRHNTLGNKGLCATHRVHSLQIIACLNDVVFPLLQFLTQTSRYSRRTIHKQRVAPSVEQPVKPSHVWLRRRELRCLQVASGRWEARTERLKTWLVFPVHYRYPVRTVYDCASSLIACPKSTAVATGPSTSPKIAQ